MPEIHPRILTGRGSTTYQVKSPQHAKLPLKKASVSITNVENMPLQGLLVSLHSTTVSSKGLDMDQ